MRYSDSGILSHLIGNKQTHAQYSSHSTFPSLPIGAICNMCNCIVASPPICQSVRAVLLKRCSMRTERSKRIKKPREKHIIMRGAITTYERLLLDDEWGNDDDEWGIAPSMKGG